MFLLPLHDLLLLENGSITSDHHNEDGDGSKHEDSEINSESKSDNGTYFIDDQEHAYNII